MVFKLLGAVILGAFLAAGGWVWQRWSANPETVMPLPYKLARSADTLIIDAPLLIIGDRMGARFALFKDSLSEVLSRGLSKPLKIQSLAEAGFGLHRTLRQLQSLDTWPRVIFYQGGSQEMHENKFLTKEIPKIRRNFFEYADDTKQTAMMLYPALSRLIYLPYVRTILPDSPPLDPVAFKTEREFQARLEITYQLYEMELNRLVDMAREHKALLIFSTVPINIDIPPRKTCDNAASEQITKAVAAIRELVRAHDHKTAYARSKELVSGTIANAEVHYLHGQIARRVGNLAEAMDHLHQAAAYDCRSWRATQVTNNIIRKVATEQRVMLFDFARMVESDWTKNATFFDELNPQNLYYQKAVDALGSVLRRVLKL